MKQTLLVLLLSLAVGGLSVTVPSSAFSLSSGASLKGDSLVVEIPADDGPGKVHCEAELDLAGSSILDFGVALSLRVRAWNVTKPDAKWNGVKVMFRYVGADTGTVYWPGATLPIGSFDWTNAEVHINALNATEQPADGKATLILGLEGCTGRVEFDLSSLHLAPENIGIPRINEDWIVRYPGSAGKVSHPLRGCMLPGRDTTEGDVAELAAWGATLVRFQITRNWGMPNDNQDLAEYAAWVDSRLDNLADVLSWCDARGMQVCVDLHAPPGGKRPGDLAMNMFFEERWAEAFVETWQRIATRFQGHPALYGYDLVNEPDQRVPAPINYWEIQRRAAEAVRAIDPNTPIIVESNLADSPGAFRTLSPLAMDNVIYQVHVYMPMAFTHQGVYGRRRSNGPGDLCWPGTHGTETWDRDFLRRVLAPVRDFQNRHKCRIYVGEFSAAIWAPGAENYLRDCIALFEEYGWDWTYHAFREASVWDVEMEALPDGSRVPAPSDTPRKRALLEGFSATH